VLLRPLSDKACSVHVGSHLQAALTIRALGSAALAAPLPLHLLLLLQALLTVLLFNHGCLNNSTEQGIHWEACCGSRSRSRKAAAAWCKHHIL
jgi:hypothetical protein